MVAGREHSTAPRFSFGTSFCLQVGALSRCSLKPPAFAPLLPPVTHPLGAREGICWTLIIAEKKTSLETKDPQWLQAAWMHPSPCPSLLPARGVEHQGLCTCSPAALTWCDFCPSFPLTTPPALRAAAGSQTYFSSCPMICCCLGRPTEWEWAVLPHWQDFSHQDASKLCVQLPPLLWCAFQRIFRAWTCDSLDSWLIWHLHLFLFLIICRNPIFFLKAFLPHCKIPGLVMGMYCQQERCKLLILRPGAYC